MRPSSGVDVDQGQVRALEQLRQCARCTACGNKRATIQHRAGVVPTLVFCRSHCTHSSLADLDGFGRITNMMTEHDAQTISADDYSAALLLKSFKSSRANSYSLESSRAPCQQAVRSLFTSAASMFAKSVTISGPMPIQRIMKCRSCGLVASFATVTHTPQSLQP